MASSNKNSHLTLSERAIIETACYNGSSKAAVAITLGKDKSTIGKEIKSHRILKHKCNLPLECSAYKKCSHGRSCTTSCVDYSPFRCNYRDRSPGVCNGCSSYSSCRFDKFYYSADLAHKQYLQSLVNSRTGINATIDEIKTLGNTLKPLIDKGQSLYAIKQNNPEISLSERTLYNYIESGVFSNVGISISDIDLPRKTRRKITKRKSNEYKKRTDRKFLIGRKKEDYDAYLNNHPNANVVEMDTVFNNISSGPFMQTFKFMKYDLLVILFHDTKDSKSMYEGILLLERILGNELFQKECEVILTDRGSEFVMADEIELRQDGSRRTRIYYCDPMASCQKGSLENIHELIRRICPKEVDLRSLGLDCQDKANLIASHINSYPKEKLNGKTSIQLTNFLCPLLIEKLKGFGADEISPDVVTLKPYLIK